MTLNVVIGKLSYQVGHLDLQSLSMKNFQTNFMFLSGTVISFDSRKILDVTRAVRFFENILIKGDHGDSICVKFL